MRLFWDELVDQDDSAFAFQRNHLTARSSIKLSWHKQAVLPVFLCPEKIMATKRCFILKKMIKWLLLGVLLISLSGCTAAPEQHATAGQTDTVQETPPQPAAGAGGVGGELNEQTALELVRLANQVAVHVMNGGNLHGEIKTFMHHDTEYRYLGGDIGTKDKLLAYLQQAYTPQVAETILSKYGFIEKSGRMAQPNADGGVLLDWTGAEAQLVEESPNTKIFVLKVPLRDEDSGNYEIKQVKFLFVDGVGWRVNQEI